MEEFLEVDSDSLQKFVKLQVTFAEIAYPRATRFALTQTAFYQQRETQKRLPRKLQLRNDWTKRSIRWNEAKMVPVSRQFSEAGSTEKYMEEQYEGKTEVSGGKHGVPIPTSFSAGQYGAKPRTRLVRKANRLSNIELGRYAKRGKNQKQRNVRAMQTTLEQGKRFVFLEFKKRKGIFKIIGGRKPKRNFKRGWPEGARLRLAWDMTNKVVRTGRNDWHSKGEDLAYGRFPKLYEAAIRFQMKRLGM